MKPLSALYYLKENKGRSLIVIFLFLFTPLLFLGGNYISSMNYYWDKGVEYYDRVAVVSALSTDEDYKEFKELRKKLKEDDDLIVLDRSAYGFAGLSTTCTMGFKLGGTSMVFNSAEDLKTGGITRNT